METTVTGCFDGYEYIPSEVIRKAIRGDEESLSEIISKYHPYLWVVLRNRMIKFGTELDFSSVEDLRATVIAKLYTGIGKFRFLRKTDSENEKMFDSYCKTIIKHEVRDELKKIISDKNRFVILSYEELGNLIPSEVKNHFDLVEIRLGNSFVLLEDERLSDELVRLRPTYQRVIELSFFLGYSDREIARILGLKISSVYEYKHKALIALKKALFAL